MAEAVIVADGGVPADGVVASAGAAGGGYNSMGGFGGHHMGFGGPTATLGQEEYYSNGQSFSGSDDGTMNVMLYALGIGYGLLIVMYFTNCFVRPGMGYGQGPFTRMPENDAESAMLKDRFVCDLEPQWRKAFITKVYTLLVVQIAITVIICTAMMQFGGYDFYVWSRTAGAWTKLTSIIVTLCLICAMFSYKREHPLNLILLFSFTVCMSYSIGITTTAYAAAGLSVLVIEAFAITAIVFIGLTAFAMYSKIDFSFLGAILPVCLLTLMVWGFFMRFAFVSFAWTQIYALAGTIIFSLYVLYDTHAICTYLSYDDHVLAAVNLYLDFINLFMFILELLTGGRTD